MDLFPTLPAAGRRDHLGVFEHRNGPLALTQKRCVKADGQDAAAPDECGIVSSQPQQVTR